MLQFVALMKLTTGDFVLLLAEGENEHWEPKSPPSVDIYPPLGYLSAQRYYEYLDAERYVKFKN